MKNISDFKASFILGIIMYAINNLFLNPSEVYAPTHILFTAHILSALSHIVLMFVLVKCTKWIVKFVLDQIM